MITLKSTLAYKNYNENLSVSPGVFTDFINNGTDYQNAFQQINFEKFSKGIKGFTLQSKIGIKYINHSMKSDLLADEQLTNSTFTNNTHFLLTIHIGQLLILM